MDMTEETQTSEYHVNQPVPVYTCMRKESESMFGFSDNDVAQNGRI